MTAESRSTIRAWSRQRWIASRPLTRKRLAGRASIRRRPGTDLSFTLTRAAIAHGGQGPQEVDVAEQRRLADGGVITAEHEAPPAAARKGQPERVVSSDIKEVRSSDIEPYTGLRYLSKLFRFMAIILVLLLVAEIATGVY